MHREGKPLGSPNEEVTNLIPSFSRAPNSAIPDRIFSEKVRDAVSVVIIVTVRAITRFKPLYLLDVLYGLSLRSMSSKVMSCLLLFAKRLCRLAPVHLVALGHDELYIVAAKAGDEVADFPRFASTA